MATRATRPQRGWRWLNDHLTLISSCLVVALVWAALVLDRISDKEGYVARSLNETSNVTASVGSNITQTLFCLDQILLVARFEGAGEPTRHLITKLIQASNLTDIVDNVSLYDSTGALLMATASAVSGTINVADRSWFIRLRDSGADVPMIVSPVLSRVTNRTAVIIARGVWDADHRFQGMVGMSVNPEHFLRPYLAVPLRRNGVINLLGTDGTVIARMRGDTFTFGARVLTAGYRRILALAEREPYGSTYIASEEAVDGVAKYLSYRKIAGFPIVVNVGLTEADVLAPWHEETATIAGVTIILSLLMLASSSLSYRRLSVIRRQAQDLRDQAEALTAAKTKAEASERVKSDFIANMNHELRTPLNSVIGFSGLLIDAPNSRLDEKAMDHLRIIHEAGHHLLAIVDAVLDLSAVENGPVSLALEPVALGKLVADCARELEPARAARGVEIVTTTAGPDLIEADPAKTRQAILNIVSNSIKFSAAGARIEIGVGSPDPERVALTIADTGIGMNEEELSLAITPFAQVSSGLNKLYGGAGLGLPLAKRLIEIQGGVFDIASARDQGTLVRLDFPALSPVRGRHPGRGKKRPDLP
ncbi:MAG: ATP-binding protein [Rhodospirillaceae bacterium]